ncbi:MAG: hypothetical protein NXI32_28225 [bacterium]|nr:hypothetical protein [bacterium]
MYRQRLSRLPREYYQGEAWVHWNLTIEDRRVGWLNAKFYYKFREILTHVAFRYGIACPIFTLMPDHMHLLWAGLLPRTQQLIAMKQFRKDTNEVLRCIGFKFQLQPYDHVLQDHELERSALENVIDYIARNPERKQLVAEDEFAAYPYTNCLLPGYPQLHLFHETDFDDVWRILAYLKQTECHRNL